MIRATKFHSYNPKGFIFILSPLWIDNKIFKDKTSFFRASYLATYIDTAETIPILFDNLYHKNVVYNGMFYHDLSNLKIINIWKSEVDDLKYRDINQEIKSKFKNDIPRTLDVLNVHFNDFFFSRIPDIIFDHINDKYKDILFFVEGENLGEVVEAFTYCRIHIAGVSTNQRHIFNPLHNRMSMYLNILLGRVWASKLSHFDFKNPNINHRPNYDISSKKSNLFINCFWKIYDYKNINDFITITKIIIESNQLATIHDEFKVIDFFRFWVTISKYEVWSKLYYNIMLQLSLDNNVTTSLNNIYNEDHFKNTLKINLDLLEQFNNIDYSKVDPIKHGKTKSIQEEKNIVNKIGEIMNINYEVINSINEHYLYYISEQSRQMVDLQDTNKICNENKENNNQSTPPAKHPCSPLRSRGEGRTPKG